MLKFALMSNIGINIFLFYIPVVAVTVVKAKKDFSNFIFSRTGKMPGWVVFIGVVL